MTLNPSVSTLTSTGLVDGKSNILKFFCMVSWLTHWAQRQLSLLKNELSWGLRWFIYARKQLTLAISRDWTSSALATPLWKDSLHYTITRWMAV